MESHLIEFLDRHYIDPEPVITTLNDIGCYENTARCFQHIMNTENPNYNTVAITIIAPIQEALKKLEKNEEKQRIESVLGSFFRDLIADLSQSKAGFTKQFREIVQSIKEMYSIKGYNFNELDELIGLTRLSENFSILIRGNNQTKHLKWTYTSVQLSHLEAVLKYYGYITQNSCFTDLFQNKRKPKITVPQKHCKSFTLTIGYMIKKGWIRSIGGKATFQYIESNILISGKSKRVGKNYMKQTYENFNKTGVGEKKHAGRLGDFIKDLHRKSLL